MKSTSASARALVRSGAVSPGPICPSCQRSLLLRQRRYYASAAAAEATPEHQDLSSPSPTHSTTTDPTATSPPVTGPKPFYALNCSIILSRPPVITRDLHPFESAYFLYQRRLNERTALPFTRYFYYKKGTPADIEWKRKQKERITPARDIGKYNAYGKDGWHDELLVDAQESERDHQMEMLLSDADTTVEDEEENSGRGKQVQKQLRKKNEIERPSPRVTEADEQADLRNLNRLLKRCLYLVVQDKDGQWAFPTSRLDAREYLSKAAERIITQAGGSNMNTWVVGNVPVGHYVQDFYLPIEDEQEKSIQLGQKTFFMKGRIMTGQANLDQNQLGLKDFRWLAKEEIQKLVTPKYWSMTENILTER